MKENDDLKDFSDQDLKIAFDQYKLIIDAQNKSNGIRESSNNFWVTINTVSLSAIAYIRDNEHLSFINKSFIIWTLIIIGITVCVSWINYLSALKKMIEIRNKYLIFYEKYFPLPVFTSILKEMNKEKGSNSLTLQEMLVPGVFLLGYIFFIVLFFLYPHEVMSGLTKTKV